jgi:hypothetical protein
VNYSVQTSTDLVNWSTAGVFIQKIGTEVTALHPMSGSGPAFLRIAVAPVPSS